jgi:hypothetical protein
MQRSRLEVHNDFLAEKNNIDKTFVMLDKVDVQCGRGGDWGVRRNITQSAAFKPLHLGGTRTSFLDVGEEGSRNKGPPPLSLSW